MILWWTAAFAYDLAEVRARATDHAIEVARAEASAHAASGEVWVARSGALPDVELFANASTGQGLTAFGFPRPVRTQLSVGATGRWRLLAPGTWAAASAAQHSLEGQRALLDWARVQARQQATTALADVWASQAERQAWQEAAMDAERAASGIDSLVQAGLRPPADGARAKAVAAGLKANAAAAVGEVEGRCAALQALLRDPVNGNCVLDVVQEPEPQRSDAVHPALVAAEEALKAAKAARVAARLDRVPTVDATGTVGEYKAGDNQGLGWSAGLEARLPLLSGGEGIGRNRVADANRDDATLALEDQTRALQAAGVAAEARWRASGTTLEALTLAADAADQAMTLVEARYTEGLEGLEAWQGARRARDEARVALAVGRANRLAVLAELEAARGVW